MVGRFVITTATVPISAVKPVASVAIWTVININAETVQDAQIQYTFGSGFAENLSLFLQFNNLGDEPFTTSNNGRPESYFEYGRQTLIGFNYRF